MRNLTAHLPSYSSILAFLLAISATDLALIVIDVTGIPLPRFVAGMPLSICIPIMVIAILTPCIGEIVDGLFQPFDFLALGLLLFWTFLEWLHGINYGHSNYILILSTTALFINYLANRCYLQIFGDKQLLARAFTVLVVFIAIIHLLLLIFINYGISIPYINKSEIESRNGISLLLISTIYLNLFFTKNTSKKSILFSVLLIILAVLHVYLNNAYSSFVFIVILLCMKLFQFFFKKNNIPTLLAISASLMVIFFSSTGVTYFNNDNIQIIKSLNIEPNNISKLTDQEISFFSRTLSNYSIIQKIKDNIIFGIGYDQLTTIRVAGYISHTLYLHYFGAYGLFGAIPLFTMAILLFSVAKNQERACVSFMYFFIILVTSVNNDPLPFFGLFAALHFYNFYPKNINLSMINIPSLSK